MKSNILTIIFFLIIILPSGCCTTKIIGDPEIKEKTGKIITRTGSEKYSINYLQEPSPVKPYSIVKCLSEEQIEYSSQIKQITSCKAVDMGNIAWGTVAGTLIGGLVYYGYTAIAEKGFNINEAIIPVAGFTIFYTMIRGGFTYNKTRATQYINGPKITKIEVIPLLNSEVTVRANGIDLIMKTSTEGDLIIYPAKFNYTYFDRHQDCTFNFLKNGNNFSNYLKVNSSLFTNTFVEVQINDTPISLNFFDKPIHLAKKGELFPYASTTDSKKSYIIKTSDAKDAFIDANRCRLIFK